MKKLVLFFAAAVAISFASCCGNQPAQPVEEAIVMEEAIPVDEDAAPVVEEEVVVEEAVEVDAAE